MDTLISSSFSSRSTLFSYLGVVLSLCLYYFLVISKDGYEKEQWVGRKKEEWFSRIRANIRSIKGMHALADEGHTKFSSKNTPYILPEFSAPPTHVLPPSQIHNVLKQPESVLDTHFLHDEAIQNKYTIRDPRVWNNQIHMDVVRRQLTRGLKYLTVDIAEELSLAVNHLWGTDAENWKEVKLMETVMKIVSRAANRSIVGIELCRNEAFIDNCKNHAAAVFGTSALIRMLPSWLRPVFGHLIARPTKKYLAACFKESRPVIEHRLRMNEKKREDPSFDWDPPNDVLQWLIEEIYARDLPEEFDVELINCRLCMVNAVAIHTTTLTTSSTILDLYSTDPSKGFVEALREECNRVLEEEKEWSKAAIAKLVRIDSAIKESMRYSNIGVLSLPRLVTSPNGLTLDHNIHVPYGARIAFSQLSIHHDSTFYPNPDKYDPLRFSAPREAYETSLLSSTSTPPSLENETTGIPSTEPTNPDSKSEPTTTRTTELQKILTLKNKSMISVSDDFLSFGHGRHACPGRFFASNEVKMLMAYIVLNYDVEFMAERIPDTRILHVSAPAMTTCIRVRRRA